MTQKSDTGIRINDLYRRVLLRDADPGAIAHYRELLDAAELSLSELELTLRNSSEYRSRSACVAMWRDFFDAELPRRFPSSRTITLPREAENCAVIVEPRCHLHLAAVASNVMTMLGEGWGLQVFHGTGNRDFVAAQLAHIENVHFTDLGVADLDATAYTTLVTSQRFWQSVRGAHVLYFQTDALLRRPGIEEFIGYDYIGAPWTHTDPRSGTRVGNGGLSLRNRSVMQEIASRHRNPGLPADVFFSGHCRAEGYRLAPPEVACTFSVENLYSPDPLGLHKAYFELEPEQLRSLLMDIRAPG